MDKLLASVVFLKVHDEFLIIDRASLPFGWALPGGRVEPGEDPLDAAVREMHEECGVLLDRSSLEFNGVFTSANSTYLVHLYSASLSEKPEVTIQPREVNSYQWITADNIHDYVWSGKSKIWVEQLNKK